MSTTSEVGYWKPVVDWCLGENDHLGTCFLAMVGNHHVVVTTANGAAEVMSDGEIEVNYHAMTGFMPTDRSTDRGDSVVAMLQYWAAHGWVGDPTLKPVGWWPITQGEILDTVDLLGCAYGWYLLPMRAGDYDFTDEAVRDQSIGIAPHAMLIVGAGPGFYHVVTSATVKLVSEAWLTRFGQGYFGVRHPAWRRPAPAIA